MDKPIIAKKVANATVHAAQWLTLKFGDTWLWRELDQASAAWGVLQGQLPLDYAQEYLECNAEERAKELEPLKEILALLMEAILVLPSDLERAQDLIAEANAALRWSSRPRNMAPKPLSQEALEKIVRDLERSKRPN